jgi:hypothetical protein
MFLVINISAPVQIDASQNRPQTSINIAGETSSSNSQLGASTGVRSVGIAPAPVVQVNQDSGEAILESPFVQITRQSAESNNSLSQDFSQPPSVDNTLQQVRELTQQQQSIQSRKEQLQNQEEAIEKEISQLQQKELDINRKRFQLQQQSTGNLLNILI